MIDWAIEAWNDYSKDLKEYLQNEEVIKEIKNSDESKNTQGIGCVHHDEYIKLAKIVIDEVLNKGLENRYDCIGTDNIISIETGEYGGDIHLILPMYAGLTYHKDMIISECYYTTIYYGSCCCCDAVQYALSSYGDDRTNALMRIALTMVQNLRRMGDE